MQYLIKFNLGIWKHMLKKHKFLYTVIIGAGIICYALIIACMKLKI